MKSCTIDSDKDSECSTDELKIAPEPFSMNIWKGISGQFKEWKPNQPLDAWYWDPAIL
jgi:hypothetical protein